MVQYDEMYPSRKDKKKVKRDILQQQRDLNNNVHVGACNILKDKSNIKLYYTKKQEWIIGCVGYNQKEGRFNHRFQRLAVDPKTGKVRGATEIKPFMMKHQKENSKVWVDGWRGYGGCSQWMACEYETVNHVDNYRDPTTGAHHDWIERE